MERKEEIEVLIDYLTSEVTRYSSSPLSYADKIVEVGKLIEKYQKELANIK